METDSLAVWNTVVFSDVEQKTLFRSVDITLLMKKVEFVYFFKFQQMHLDV
jgi:hypothetical protein